MKTSISDNTYMWSLQRVVQMVLFTVTENTVTDVKTKLMVAGDKAGEG